eukprot:9498694-Pyramimonas_sp.AAC.1
MLAGDAFATGFMKLMPLQPLDQMVAQFGAITPSIVVDDLVLQRWGGTKRVEDDLAVATRVLVQQLKN